MQKTISKLTKASTNGSDSYLISCGQSPLTSIASRKASKETTPWAILLVFCGWWVIAVIDFVTIAVYDKVYWFDFNDKKFFADTAESAAENNDVKTEDVKPEETKTQNADEGNTNADKID